MQNEPRIPRRCSIFPGRAPHPPRPSRRWGAVAALVVLAAVLGIATPEDAQAQELPGPPQNFTATAGDTQVVLTWDAPADGGGAPITAYQYRTAVGATVPEFHSWIQLDGADSLEATVPGLTNGTRYAFEVRALNSAGTGEGSVATATATPVADVTLTWDAREAGLEPSFTVTITFLEAVEGFTLEDITVNAINISDLPGLGSAAFHQWELPVENFQMTSATTYSVKVTPVSLTITVGPMSNRTPRTLLPQKVRVIIPVNAVQAVDGGTPNRQKRQLIDLNPQVNICDRTDQVEEKILSLLTLTDCTSVPSDRLASIPTLNFLDVPVNSLQADDFDWLSGLRTLNLIRVGLTTLPAGVFDQLGSLTRLSLTENMLTALPAGVFDQLSSLTTLYLAGNMLTALPAGVFAELSSLTTMELDRNPLSTLSAGMFTGLSSLTELDLYDIDLSTLPAGVFAGLGSLTRLHLHNQQNKRSGEPEKEGDPPFPGALAPLPAGVFAGLSSLTWLKLDEPYSPYILRPQILASLNRLNFESSYTPPAVPGAPTGLTATFTDTDSTITLSWTAPTGGESPTSYQILRKADQAAQEVYVEDTYYICTDPDPVEDLTTCAMAATTYIDPTVARGVTYTYEVVALNAGGKGDKSSPATEITPPIIMPDSLGVPQNFSATAGDTRVVLSWTAPASDGGTAITTYQYRYSAGSTVDTSATWTDVPDGADADTDAGNERTVTVTSLTNGTQYAFEVRAVNSGDGPAATTTPIIPTPLTSTDATLNALALSDASDNLDIPLSPDFASGTMIYMASVRNRVDKITIAPTRNNNGARVAYLDGSDMPIPDADTKSGQQVSLEVGANTIEVQVTAEDTTTTLTYTVTVTRAPAPPVRTSVSGGGGGGGSSQDDHGNTPAQATPVTLDPTRTSSTGGQINTAPDVDYFSADVPHAGVLVVETSGSTATMGTVWQAGEELATAARGGVGQNFRLSVRVAPGPVVIAVAGNGQQTGRYTLQVTFLPGYLENPGAASFQSGIGVISGWTCDAEEVEIVLNGEPQEAAYGTARLDTEAVCGDADNGFGLLFNWNLLGDGAHEVVALVDGVELDRATVMVTTLGAEFLRDVTGRCTAADFPTMDETVTLAWQQTQQNFVIAEGAAPAGPANRTGRAGVGYLENPGPNSFQSGIGVISGWACEGTEVIIELNGEPQPAAYGTERLDTEEACGDTANGFGLLFNWNLLGEGEHEVVAFVDGEELGRATVRVTTLGVEFVRDVEGECTVEDFPMLGETVTLEWQQNSQNFVVTDVE